MRQESSSVKYVVKGSFLEIYNDKIYDLLDGGSSSTAEPSANVSISCSDLRDSHCYSQYIITLEGTGGLTPKEACCVCGANIVAYLSLNLPLCQV